MDESTQHIKDCFDLLIELGIIDSQWQFSAQFLNACKNYYSVIQSQKRQVPNNMLHYLNGKMTQLTECFQDERILELANQGHNILNSRFEQFMTRL